MPSLSRPSLGVLITELSPTTAATAGDRKEGQTIPEHHRTQARRTAQLILGVPVAIGTIIVGVNLAWSGIG
jgi:hypothetical protein